MVIFHGMILSYIGMREYITFLATKYILILAIKEDIYILVTTEENIM